MSLYLSVDCGGSKTLAAIANASGDIVGRAVGGPSNFAYVGPAVFIETVRETVINALKACPDLPFTTEIQLPPPVRVFAYAWFGVSGVDSQADIANVTPPLSSLLSIPPGPRLSVGNDAQLLAAPVHFHKDVRYAVTAVGGTGSICVSFKEGADGKMEEMGRVGGWGWVLGDEGGGFHVGREAIRQVLIEYDKASVGPPHSATGPKKTLTDRIIEHFGINHLLEVLSLIHYPDPPSTISQDVILTTPPNLAYRLIPREKRLSQLSPLVFQSAFEDHDPIAIRVLSTTSDMLAEEIAILLRPEDGEGPFPSRAVKASESVMCFGGSLVGIESYRNLVLKALERRGHVFKYVEFVSDAAALGATGLAAAAQLL
ncbi:hypothetical protein JAAARDRAFT_37643 [Jaapia argillacea MUCL 33604]|uniref:N-acetyl-D-glucosamine kinase n=1 Tax=Jaapia argillacea MUCL 33604 TaxID=933084 RepID=A0A067PXQ0_9AGAM|nr:hypothetical protein JAAARDRAFT_37643 [Jaapia argillacea MUCL 33604]